MFFPGINHLLMYFIVMQIEFILLVVVLRKYVSMQWLPQLFATTFPLLYKLLPIYSNKAAIELKEENQMHKLE